VPPFMITTRLDWLNNFPSTVRSPSPLFLPGTRNPRKDPFTCRYFRKSRSFQTAPRSRSSFQRAELFFTLKLSCATKFPFPIVAFSLNLLSLVTSSSTFVSNFNASFTGLFYEVPSLLADHPFWTIVFLRVSRLTSFSSH